MFQVCLFDQTHVSSRTGSPTRPGACESAGKIKSYSTVCHKRSYSKSSWCNIDLRNLSRLTTYTIFKGFFCSCFEVDRNTTVSLRNIKIVSFPKAKMILCFEIDLGVVQITSVRWVCAGDMWPGNTSYGPCEPGEHVQLFGAAEKTISVQVIHEWSYWSHTSIIVRATQCRSKGKMSGGHASTGDASH